MNWLKRKMTESKTSADFRAAIEEAEAKLSASQARVRDLRDAREAVLLEGEPEAARRNKAAIGDAESDVEQCEVQLSALRKSLEEAMAAEGRAALDREIEACKSEHREAVDLISHEYAAAAATMVRVMERLREIELHRMATKKEAHAKGVIFPVPIAEADACAGPRGQFRVIANYLTLPSATNSMRNAWGPGPMASSLAGALLGVGPHQADQVAAAP